MSILTNFQSLWKSFIRPNRSTYKESDLGNNL